MDRVLCRDTKMVKWLEHLSCEETQRDGTIQPRQDLVDVEKYLEYLCKEEGAHPVSGTQWQEQRQRTQTIAELWEEGHQLDGGIFVLKQKEI